MKYGANAVKWHLMMDSEGLVMATESDNYLVDLPSLLRSQLSEAKLWLQLATIGKYASNAGI